VPILFPSLVLHIFHILIMDQELNKGSIIQMLHSHRKELVDFGVERIGLFGSYHMDNMRPESDIDFLVEYRRAKRRLETLWLWPIFSKTCSTKRSTW
jgi:predicted nucleotidyltransferase